MTKFQPLLALVFLLFACNRAGTISVEVLAPEEVSTIMIGGNRIKPNSTDVKYIGIRLNPGEYDVEWTCAGMDFEARIDIYANEDNYLVFTKKEPWLEVDGGMKLLEQAKALQAKGSS